MALLAISAVRILSCRTVTDNGRRIQQFVGNTKKPFEESLRLKRLGIDKIKDTEIDETKDENTEETKPLCILDKETGCQNERSPSGK